jgi:ubiquinone/menaquinone biosynthesis C-methylase UbiE
MWGRVSFLEKDSMKNTTTEFFETHAREYDGFQSAVVPHYEDAVTMVAEAFKQYVGEGTFLDLGCGSGNVSMKLLKASPGSRAFLVDASPSMIEIALKKITAHAGEHAVIGSKATHLEDRDWQRGVPGRLDAVVTVFVLEHLREEDYRAVIQRCHELLRPGGVFISLEWGDNEYGMQDWFRADMDARGEKHPQYAEYIREANEMERHYFVNIREKMAWIADAGYRDVHTIWQYLFGSIVVGVKD